MNSLLIATSIFAFICAGYLFLVKRFNQSYRDEQSTQQATTPSFLSTFSRSIQSNALLFTALTSVISLYWGWSPAILWLVIGALFIHFNMETVLHERLVDEYESDEDDELISHYFLARDNWQKFIGLNILNAFSALASIILIVIASEIMSKYTGSAIAVIALALAVIIWQNNSTTKTGRLCSISVAIIGIILSDKIGLYFIGSWQPIAKFPAIVVDEVWLFAIILVLLFKQIKSHESESITHFLSLFAKVSNYCSAAIILSAFYFLAIARPLIDAPIHTQSGNTPYYFLIIALIAVVGATNLLNYLKRLSNPLPASLNEVSPLRRNHSKVLFEVFGLIALVFLLASSNGIGAWSSHFVNWDADRSLMLHLNLVIDSISNIYSDLTERGISETSIKNFIATIFLFNGLCLLNDNSTSKEFLGEKIQMHKESSPLQKNIGQLFFYGFLVCTLILGTTINSWLLLGSLSLAGIAWVLLCDSHLTLECEISNPTILLVTAVITPLAGVQIFAQCWLWWSSQNWLYAACGTLLALGYILTVASHGPSLAKKYTEARKQTPLPID